MIHCFFNVRTFSYMISLSILMAFSGCGPDGGSAGDDSYDVHSYAKPAEALVTHIDLDLSVNFDKKELAGTAALSISNKSGTNKLHLDTRDLTIEKVTLDEAGTETAFTLGEAAPYLGQEMIVDILPETRKVTIHYRSAPQAEALQWLSPSQTAGGQHPFLFTQSQAILARTWVPCQDSPGIRITYTATIRTDPSLMAVMSAENGTVKTEDGIYTFKMTQPIPSYLLALAVGDIEYRALGPRSGVYAEPSVIAKAAFEFGDTERMMDAAEALYGPYRWDKYDIIVLPPSFPFGGMENPRLTFATPTILAGDRSLVSLVAHELAHSWSGNLVTNATWNDFWLNEGFTVYFEYRIMEALYGAEYANMLAQLGFQDCQAAIKSMGADSPDTHLFLNLKGRNPDDGMTSIAYDKGSLFLRMLEQEFGREKFDDFLKTYFNEFAFKTMTSRGFLEYMNNHLLNSDPALRQRLQIDEWIYGPGLPSNSPKPTTEEFRKVETQVSAWSDGKSAADLQIDQWTTHHWLHFLRSLPNEISSERMADLDQTFGFTRSGNSEIQFAWFMHTIANKYQPADQALHDFLTGVGRRKFIKPLFEQLIKTEDGRKRAESVYKEARPGYHPVTYQTIDEILDWKTD